MKQVKPSSKAYIWLPFFCLAILTVAVGLGFGLAYAGTAPTASSSGSSQSQESSSGQSSDPSSSDGEGESLEHTVLIGDSRTHGLATYGFLSQKQVYAMDGANQQTVRTSAFVDLGDGKELTIAQALKKSQPKRVVLAFGVNGLPSMNESTFLAEYEALVSLVKEASPDSEIVIQAMLPVSSAYSKANPLSSNSRIEAFNIELESYADQNKFGFLDFAEEMRDSKGGLSSEYDAGDGLHFTSQAYSTILSALRRELGKL